eukprot:gene738-1040_t
MSALVLHDAGGGVRRDIVFAASLYL